MRKRALRTPAAKPSREDAEERLCIEAAQKDPRRFGELYDAHFERVYAFIARRVNNRAEVEDFTSEVFRRALQNIGKFEWRGAPFAAWLLRIAANALADRWKRIARERAAALLDDPAEPRAQEMADAAQRARLFRLVSALPADQRRVVEMRFAEESSIREIAQTLGRSDGAVKQLQFRALQNLRQQLGEKNG